MPQKPPRRRTGGATSRPPATPAASFASLLKPLIPPAAKPRARATLALAPLADLDYEAELRFKDEALSRFWRAHRLPGRPEPTVASPKPRGYRSTSKRRCQLRGSALFLLFGDRGLERQKRPFLDSPLEPADHGRIYRFLQAKLSEPAYRLVAAHLNHLIIRGPADALTVIFNVDAMTGPLVRKLKLLAGHLGRLAEPATAAFVYHDPSRSAYYLESRRPADSLGFKKLFGPNRLTATYGGRRYAFHPTSFSQVNESMVETLLTRARDLLDPRPDERLIDLYCGYGLFSHFLAPLYRQVLGIDAEGPSIKAATDNGRLNPDSGNTRFLAHRITGAAIAKMLPAPSGAEAILLDPPRQGPQSGVIAALAKRRPQKALHIFCGVDQIPAALGEWQQHGYRPRRTVVLDMFPGSANLEILVLLTPGRSTPGQTTKGGRP